MKERLGGGIRVISGASAIAVVGLAQLLAVGALSVTALGRDAFGAGVVAALVGGTIGALCVALIARAPGEVCGPRTSIAVIYAALCADLVARAGPQASFGEIWAALSIAVVLMGVLQAIAGWLRIGDAIKFMPYPVSIGFVTGIGLLIVWSQVGSVLGLDGRLSDYEWPDVLDQIKPAALLIAALTALTVWVYPRFAKRGQPLLAGLGIGTASYHATALLLGPEHLGPTLGTIAPVAAAAANASALWSRLTPLWLLETALYVLPYAVFLALQAIMNAAVSSVAVAEITGVRANISRTLVAQGAGNILCGALAALPLGASPSQSMPAARMKGINALVPATSYVVLLLSVLLFGWVFAYIPVAVLAGILVTVGLGMIDRWARALAKRVVRSAGKDTHVTWNLIIVAAVAGTFFFGSVPLALFVGTVLATILLAINLSAATTFSSEAAGELASTRVWSREQAQWLTGARSAIRIFRPRGGLFFGTADQLSTRLSALGPGIRYCVLDLSKLTALDATGCQIVAASARKLSNSGITTILAGLSASNPREEALIALGLTHPDPGTQWFEDLDHALEWAETQIVKERWPHTSLFAPVPLCETPLAKGFSAAELRELQFWLRAVDVKPGTLFRRGEPGSAMYVIDQGFVEIRIGDGTEGKSTRLAAFGPGSIFGEIAMLTTDERTADAVCIEPTRLFELTREAIVDLERRAPSLHARVMANLNAHLASRLIVATSIVKAQQ